MKEIKKAIDTSLEEGWVMEKKIEEAISSFLYYKPAHYEYRTAKTVKELLDLHNEGYWITEDMGLKAVNILLELYKNIK